jgi:hypothetical protein
MSTTPAGSTAIEVVTFNTIDANKWAEADNPEYVRMAALREQLVAMSALWNAVVTATTAAEITAAYNALKNDMHKIVDLTGITPANVVFLGGSRKKRQSKKKKNQRKHHNNQ